MNPLTLITPQLIDRCKPMKIIVVCGFTKTGKAIIARELAKQLKRPLVESDDYGFEAYEYFVKDSLNLVRQMPVIIEGVLSFRLLRGGIKDNTFVPDLILKTNCNEATIRHFYEKEGEGRKINRVLAFNRSLNTIWEDYLEERSLLPWIKFPEYLELNTSL